MNNLPIKQLLLLIFIGVLIGLLTGGVIWIIASQPQGEPLILATRPSNQFISVYVSGYVVNPGVYQIPLGSRVKDAIDIAGGFLSNADVELINLAAYVTDSSHINIPSIHLMENIINNRININIATENELDDLPGIGPTAAGNVVSYRIENGPFKKIEDIQKVAGVGPVTFEKIKDLITIGE